MFWKKELMRGLIEVKGELARQQGIIAVYDNVVVRQQALIERLLDRIQAGSFKELKLAEAVTMAPRDVEEFYDPLRDEELAGLAVATGEESNGN
jgi:hypothetical protein